MLSRSSSNAAGDRLRRARSTTSSTMSSSGHQRSTTSIDPFVSRQYAEAAAVEAYHRMQLEEEPILQVRKPIPSKSRNRKNTGHGRSEGSHLEDARLGRRRSTSIKPEAVRARSSQGFQPKLQPQQIDSANETDGFEHTITRRRSVIPAEAHSTQSHVLASTRSIPSHRHGSQIRSQNTDGSPTPRRSAPQAKSSLLGMRDPAQNPNERLVNVPRISQRSTKKPVLPGTHASLPTDTENLAMARDKCLQDFHQRKVRERKSFLFAPFQKRSESQAAVHAYDTSLPPFNYAEDPDLAPSTLHLESDPAPIPPVIVEARGRNFSESIKGRFKKVFRRTSRSSSVMPPQQVEAKHPHYGVEISPATPSTTDHNLFLGFSSGYPTSKTNPEADRTHSRLSAAPHSSIRSRVTSWANSTTAGSTSSQVATECTENRRILRKKSSFFGPSIRNRLQKTQPAQPLDDCGSSDLYSALQAHMLSSSSPPMPIPAMANESDNLNSVASGIASLPSQHPTRTIRPSPNRRGTIRTVTPEPYNRPKNLPSPVAEVFSPELKSSDLDGQIPKTITQKRHAARTFEPTQQQIARRMENASNRWQTPLDQRSPGGEEDNPYQLRSLVQQADAPVIRDDLPHHRKLGTTEASIRQELLSPSIYSRATDGASIRADSPQDIGAAIVTITGREVRSYSISPRKSANVTAHPTQVSGEWRRWLSQEFRGMHSGVEEYTLTKAVEDNPRPAVTEASSLSNSPCSQSDMQTTRQKRPTSRSDNPLKFMNERYPIVEGGRNLSDNRVLSQKVSCPVLVSGPAMNKKDNGDLSRLDPRESSGNVEKNHTSRIARLPSPIEREAPVSLSSRTNSHVRAKPKSAFDLRANYKSNVQMTAKPLQVRRTTTNDNGRLSPMVILGDDTIRNISAGPYASSRVQKENVGNSRRIENTALPIIGDDLALPVISSSAWLAAGSTKSQDATRTPGAGWSGTGPHHSPVKKGPSGQRSPAQRMATEFLEKRSRENTPAFM